MATQKTKPAVKLGRPDKESLACKSRGREATMDRLIEAGIRVFSTYGYDGATTKLVANEAAINESLINRYFDGKAGLLLAIIKAFMECERSEGPFAGYPEGKTLEEDLKNFFVAMHEHHKKRAALTKIFISRAMVDLKIRDEIRTFTEKGAPSILVERMRNFQKQGQIRDDVNIPHAASVVGSASFSMNFINHIVMGTDAKFVQDAMASFARDYARGLSPTSH